MSKATRNRTVVPFSPARRGRKRIGGVMADARAEALKTRFHEVSKAAQTGDATTPLKRLLKRY
nr:hypothetical protein [uncultured Celeribacter sp.]